MQIAGPFIDIVRCVGGKDYKIEGNRESIASIRISKLREFEREADKIGFFLNTTTLFKNKITHKSNRNRKI